MKQPQDIMALPNAVIVNLLVIFVDTIKKFCFLKSHIHRVEKWTVAAKRPLLRDHMTKLRLKL
jgi:hypothetical protein